MTAAAMATAAEATSVVEAAQMATVAEAMKMTVAADMATVEEGNPTGRWNQQATERSNR